VLGVRRRWHLVGALVALVATVGCIGLTPAEIPGAALDPGQGNGWARDTANSTDVSGGLLQKQATRAYRDPAVGDEGFPGDLKVVSIGTLLSPDRQELRERVRGQLEDNARRQGLELDEQVSEGQRRVADGALSFYVVFNATATDEEGLFGSGMRVKYLGEVFRCTGGPTVVATGAAQVEGTRTVGGVETERRYDPQTWAEIVRGPNGSIEGYTGSGGLVDRIGCP
jgi:hypothetical protein